MTKLTLNYYQDPSHGWVKIHKSWLSLLAIEDKISRYSYMRKNYAYLEEDCDLSTLFAAADAAGIKIVLREYHTDKQSKIRSYASYNYMRQDNQDFMHWLKDNGKLQLITIGG